MNGLTIEEYLTHYLPGLIGRYLSEDPVPDMEGTLFTLQITIAGENDLVFGITIRDAKQITVTPGGLKNPQVALQIPEQAIKPLVKLVSSLTGRGRYTMLERSRGSMDVEIVQPGGEDIPIRMVFNGSEEPNFRICGLPHVLGKIAAGSVDPAQAFMQGLITLYGDFPFALQLSQLVRK